MAPATAFDIAFRGGGEEDGVYHLVARRIKGKKVTACGLDNGFGHDGPFGFFNSTDDAEMAGFIACRSCFGGGR